MSTFTCTFDGLKQAAKELIDSAPTLTLVQLENGWKGFALFYLGMVPNANKVLGDSEVLQASYVLKITMRHLHTIRPDWLHWQAS